LTPDILVENLHYHYRRDGQSHHALRGISLRVDSGEMVAILGPSGSGKSTLLYVLGCLIRPENGRLEVFGKSVANLSDIDLALMRSEGIGFVFQQFHLIPKLTVAQNIQMAGLYPMEAGRPIENPAVRLKEISEKLAISELLHKMPNQLSGGQQQRVAIARALYRNPQMILADEPTGNLDSVNSEIVFRELEKLHDEGKTVVIITHDRDLAERCGRIVVIRDGSVAEDRVNSANGGSKINTSKSKSIRSLSMAGRMVGGLTLSARILPQALSGVVANWWRSALTMIGVVIGVAAVLSLLTLGSFTRDRILETYEAMGVNKLSVYGYRNWRMRAADSNAVMFQSFDVKRDMLPLYRIFDRISLISPQLQTYGLEANFGGSTLKEVNMVGVSEVWTTIRNLRVESGRALSPHDVSASAAVCVIGSEIREQIFVDRMALGHIIYLNNSNQVFQCTVVGVLAPVKVGDPERSPNRLVIVPYPYMQQVSDNWSRQIGNFVMQVESGTDISKLGDQVTGFFRHRYGSTGQFNVETDDVMVSQMKRFLEIFTILLGSIGAISLIVGGIGITNMMMVTVAERYREIGLRKALGATDASLWNQTLIESMIICGFAGIIGLLVGFVGYESAIFAATKFVDKLQFEWVVEWPAVLLSGISIVLVGVGSGIVPALRARRLQVIEAMRSE
jgi:macrolide transport system ATP-binding/permease protein